MYMYIIYKYNNVKQNRFFYDLIKVKDKKMQCYEEINIIMLLYTIETLTGKSLFYTLFTCEIANYQEFYIRF